MRLKILLIILSQLCFFSCKKSSSRSDTEFGYPVGIEIGDEDTANNCSLPNCSEERIVRLIANDVEGTIWKDTIGNELIYGITYSLSFDSYLRLYICSLPEEFRIDNLEIRYSGDLLDACGVREAVWPVEENYLLNLTKIKKQ